MSVARVSSTQQTLYVAFVLLPDCKFTLYFVIRYDSCASKQHAV